MRFPRIIFETTSGSTKFRIVQTSEHHIVMEYSAGRDALGNEGWFSHPRADSPNPEYQKWWVYRDAVVALANKQP